MGISILNPCATWNVARISLAVLRKEAEILFVHLEIGDILTEQVYQLSCNYGSRIMCAKMLPDPG